MTPCNGTTSTPSKLVATRLAHYNGTLHWHHPLPPPQHTTMAPSNGTTSAPPKLVVALPSPHHSTLQWHPAMAPSNGTTSAPPKLVVALPAPHHSTLQWHPAMAPSNGTTSAPPKLVVTLPLNHSTLQWHPTMAPSNGTTSTAPCNGTLVPRPIRQSGSSPSPLLEVRTPIAIAIWGKKNLSTSLSIYEVYVKQHLQEKVPYSMHSSRHDDFKNNLQKIRGVGSTQDTMGGWAALAWRRICDIIMILFAEKLRLCWCVKASSPLMSRIFENPVPRSCKKHQSPRSRHPWFDRNLQVTYITWAS